MTRVLITGCSTGFGRAAAIECAKRGHEVIATARRPETLEDLDVVDRIALDVTDGASVASAVAKAGPIDVLVNNAGIDIGGALEMIPIEDAQRVFDTNVWGVFRMMQAVIPQMRERGSGRIINVSSGAGRVVAPLMSVYAASKHALGALSEGAHHELGHFGIKVVIIEPGEFVTDIQGKLVHHGCDRPPYEELERQWDAASARLSGGEEIPGPEPVAVAIADAVDDTDPRVHRLIGADVELAVGTRDAMDFETFVATMRETLGLTW